MGTTNVDDLVVTGNLSVTGDAQITGDVTETVTEAEIVLADNTTNNASTTKHGFLKKLSNSASEFMNGVGAFAAVTKSNVGLANADNTADTAKPVSTAQQTALDLKQDVITNPAVGVGSGYKVARGEHAQIAASDTVASGLATVISVVVSPRTRTVKQLFFDGSPGDQAGAPAAGSFLITSQKPTAVNDVTPTAATDFTDNVVVDWIAVGT